MATKTISIETDAYDLLAQEKKDRTESFSRVIRRLFAERPALTAGDLLDVMQEFRGKAGTAIAYGATLVARERALSRTSIGLPLVLNAVSPG
jgi:predicted CopG family antitoxin